jgi:SAM-dependent methyltransferase
MWRLKMPTSTGQLKNETIKYIKDHYNSDISILDVGPGDGTYSRLLRDTYPNMDCCEIFMDYMAEFKLQEKYRNVFISDICDFKFDYYDLVIMGDVLEHLEKERAWKLLYEIYPKCGQMIVAVPYEFPEGLYGQNKYEIHLQPDLTPSIMAWRYPQLRELVIKYDKTVFPVMNNGIYIKNPDWKPQ